LLGLPLLTLSDELAPQNKEEFCFCAVVLYIHLLYANVPRAKRQVLWRESSPTRRGVHYQNRLAELYPAALALGFVVTE